MCVCVCVCVCVFESTCTRPWPNTSAFLREVCWRAHLFSHSEHSLVVRANIFSSISAN